MARKRSEKKPTGNGNCAEHDFTLVLAGNFDLETVFENDLFEAGCDDATFSIRCGRAFLTFTRLAPTRKEAIFSAIRDVKKSNLGLEVVRVDSCELVSQADIAKSIGRTRQLVHQYVIGRRGPGGFPPPAYNITDDHPLWYWCDVAHWLHQNDMVSERVLQEARADSLINRVLELNHQRRIDPRLTKEVFDRLGSN